MLFGQGSTKASVPQQNGYDQPSRYLPDVKSSPCVIEEGMS